MPEVHNACQWGGGGALPPISRKCGQVDVHIGYSSRQRLLHFEGISSALNIDLNRGVFGQFLLNFWCTSAIIISKIGGFYKIGVFFQKFKINFNSLCDIFERTGMYFNRNKYKMASFLSNFTLFSSKNM